jgi:hypothetical protein
VDDGELTMPRFQPGTRLATATPTVTVDPGITPGRHVFTLVVVDDQGNESAPAQQIVVVRGST